MKRALHWRLPQEVAQLLAVLPLVAQQPVEPLPAARPQQALARPALPAQALEPAPWVQAQQLVQVLARRAQACSAQVLVVARWPVPARPQPMQPWPRMAVACWPPKVRRYRAR